MNEAPLIDAAAIGLEEMLSHKARDELVSIVGRINDREGAWAHTAHKLSRYREGLRETFQEGGDTLRIVEFGAGITYLFNYLLVKSLFPRRAIRFLALDMDFSNEMKHRSYYRGDEIEFLSADAADKVRSGPPFPPAKNPPVKSRLGLNVASWAWDEVVAAPATATYRASFRFSKLR